MRVFVFLLSVWLLSAFSFTPVFIDKLSSSLNLYYKARPEQQIYINFHQPKYVAGDTVFFKGYLFQKENLSVAAGKHIVNIELLDKRNDIILSERILFTNGQGAGHLILKPDLQDGYHTLRAYSDEMAENFDTLSFLYKPFLIAGKERIFPSTDELLINFEGGKLLEGIRNTTVLKSPPSTLVKIVHDETIVDTSFVSNVSGWTKFTFQPSSNTAYSVIVGNTKLPLPKVQTDGVSILLNQSSYNVILKTSRNSLFYKKMAYAVVSAGQNITFSTALELLDNSKFSIPAKAIADGLNRLTVFSDEGTVLGERLFYSENEPLPVTCDISPTVVNTRSHAQLSIKIMDRNGVESPSGNLSVTITKDEYFTTDSTIGFRDIKKIVISESLAPLRNPLTQWEQTEAGFDNYLILNYRKTIPWAKVLSGNFSQFKKASPYYLKGRAIFKESNKPLPDSSFLTFYLNDHENVFGRHTKNGNFIFPMYMNFGDDHLFYRAESNGKILTGVTLLLENSSRVDERPIQFSPSRTKEADEYFKFAAIKQIAEKSFNFYGTQRTGVTVSEEIQGDWRADFYVDLKKLKTFASIPEVFHEAVPMVQVKRRNEQNIVRVFLKHLATYGADNPVYIIDGIMTDNTDFFVSLSPQKLSMVKVLRSKETLTHFGALGKNGVVIIQSKTGEYKEAAIASSNSSIHVQGLQESIPFHFPEYQNNDKQSYRNKPDLRAALYWNPSVLLKNGEAEVKFTTSDLIGPFTITIEGVTTSGRFISTRKTFDVVFAKSE